MEDETVPEVPLALVTNAYLDKKAAQIRSKSILWEVKRNNYFFIAMIGNSCKPGQYIEHVHD